MTCLKREKVKLVARLGGQAGNDILAPRSETKWLSVRGYASVNQCSLTSSLKVGGISNMIGWTLAIFIGSI